MLGWLTSLLVLLVHSNSARITTPTVPSHSTGLGTIHTDACTVTPNSTCRTDGMPGGG
jgi:hypothetical protein